MKSPAPLHGPSVTRHDAPVSVRAAYTRDELRRLAGEAGLRDARLRTDLLANRVALVAVPPTRAPRP